MRKKKEILKKIEMLKKELERRKKAG